MTHDMAQVKRRQQAAQLLEDVLDERLTAQVAINRWPSPEDQKDPSLHCAFLALWHLEADEVQQQTEIYYMDAQLELLRQMSNYLKAGKDLPDYMLANYIKRPWIRFYLDQSLWKDYQLRIQQRWHHLSAIWNRALALLPLRKKPPHH